VFINRRTFDDATGAAGPFEHGLLMLKDEKWKNARSIVSPTFSTAKLKAMYGLMNEISDIYNKRLLEYADKQEIFDIKVLNGQYTLDNIASCLFGIETNSLQNENVTLINHLRKFFPANLSNLFLLVIIISPKLAGYLAKKGFSLLPSAAINYITNIINQILSRRRQHLERRNDFIQIMVDHEKEIQDEEQTSQQTEKQEGRQWGTLSKTLNDKEIIGQALIFMIAGYETTSVLMSFFFYVMATEPIIQEKVYEEIRQELGDDEVTHEKLSQLQYLDMVINETLRMYPPVIRFDRVASEDYQLGNYHIPKGSLINVPVYPIHHDPNIWPEPEKFIPERFLPDEKAKRHPMSFLPFGDGPRNCIGMRFALLEAKLAIAKALRVVEFQRCEKTEVPLHLRKLALLNSTNPIWLRVARRSQ
jgi:cytochrome P450 family 3 subfamily A